MKSRLAAVAVVAAFVVVVGGCSSSKTDVVALHLNSGGCQPGGLALPDHAVTLRVTNDSGSGELEIQDEHGDRVAKLAQIDQGQTKDLKIDLKTGYYSVECRTDGEVARLTVGTPSGRPWTSGPSRRRTRRRRPATARRTATPTRRRNLVASSAAYDPQVVEPGPRRRLGPGQPARRCRGPHLGGVEQDRARRSSTSATSGVPR